MNKEAIVLETLPHLKWLKTNISGENKDSPRIINPWTGAGVPGKQWVQQELLTPPSANASDLLKHKSDYGSPSPPI